MLWKFATAFARWHCQSGQLREAPPLQLSIKLWPHPLQLRPHLLRDRPSKIRRQRKKPKGGEGGGKKAGGQGQGGGAEEVPITVARLNMRIGRIVKVEKHPDADSLYVEEVDVGEGKNRTIVSGLVKHVPLEQMQDRVAVFVLNLKPAKMRGVLSEGMIMCASTPDKVEILEPPPGVEIGERVNVQDYPGEPDPLLNPKKKIWEQIQPDLRVNEEGLATYKGKPWIIEGKGMFKAATMRDSIIK